jgi:hypothetical protein
MAKFKVIDPAGGFYIGRRRFGQVFDAPDDFPEKWCEKVEEDTPAQPAQEKPKPVTLAEGGKEVGVDHGEVDFA